MYSVIVPFMNPRFARTDKNKTVEALKKAKVNRVLLALEEVSPNEDEQNAVIALLKDNMEFMKENGFTCGVWMLTFAAAQPNNFIPMVGLSGEADSTQSCPLDKNYREFQKGFLRKLAALSPDIILYDDDFRFGNLNCKIACLCDNHIKDICERVGENVSREFLRDKILHGEGNKYRSAYIDSLGDSLRLFSKEMREAVDEVNPSVRLGMCACISSWDIEGVDPCELVRILAGNTKPYLRLIGAPYWANGNYWGNRLQDIINMERLESVWCGDCDDIEIVSEGDVYPRPRHVVPASYLECFDAVLRATKSNDGIMKYMLDYNSSPSEYEKGYLAFHNHDLPYLEKIEEQFEGLSACGVNVAVKQRKFRNMSLREDTTEEFIQDAVFPISERFTAANALPTVFNGFGEYNSQVIFGEDAKYVADFNVPTVIDLTAAEILKEKGVDVGIVNSNELIKPKEQYFEQFDEYTPCPAEIEAKNLILSEKAKVLGNYLCKNGTYPSMYTYTNEKGQQFFVVNFASKYTNEAIYRNYCLQKLLVDFTNPCVYCLENPDLYIYCAKNGKKMSVVLANLFEDRILEPKIHFNCDVDGSSFDFNNCQGKVENNLLTLSTLGAYEFASFNFEVK